MDENALEVLDRTVGLLLDRVPDGCDPVNLGMLLVSIDERPAGAVNRISLADCLKLAFPPIFRQRKPQVLRIIKLDGVYNGLELGQAFGLRCRRLFVWHEQRRDFV